MPEMVEDKAKQGQPSPVPEGATAKPGVRAEQSARAGVVLTALAWGAALAYGMSGLASMGSSLTESGPSLRLGGLVAGAGLAAFLAWFGLKRMGGHLRWAKPGLGRWVRGLGLLGVAALAGFGSVSFYMLPSLKSLWWADIAQGSVLGMQVSLKPILFAALGIFGSLMLMAYGLVNRERWADFLIETEGEVKKVSWPARKDYVGSAVVVVLVIVVVSVFLWLADEGLSQVMKKLKIGF